MANLKKPTKAVKIAVLPVDSDPYLALRQNQFIPYFQPLVALRTGQLFGFEALARWQHPARGLIPPSSFITIAERDGWIDELTRQVLEKALAAASAIPDPLTLAFNISPVQLRDRSLPGEIRRMAAAAAFPLSRLIIEITETALVDEVQSAFAIISELKAMGCIVALDDFGTGYSSMQHLRSLPFDKLKVDRSFVGSMVEQTASRKIVAAVVGLGQSLGLTTVAEGIETQEQAEMMLRLGCDLGQGYFYGRPIPAEELASSVAIDRQPISIKNSRSRKRSYVTHSEVSPTQRLAQLQAICDAAPVGLGFVDRELRCVNLNKRLADMNESDVEDRLGCEMSEMFPELFLQIEPCLRRALGGESISDIEVRTAATRQTRLVSFQPTRDDTGEIAGVAIAVLDITQRKRIEDELRESEGHYRKMAELNQHFSWITDARGRSPDADPRLDPTGDSINMQSSAHEWPMHVHPQDLDATLLTLTDCRRTGSCIDVEFRAWTGGISWQWKRAKGSPRLDDCGNTVCWYGSVQDIEAPSQPSKQLSTRIAPVIRADMRDLVANRFLMKSAEVAKQRRTLLYLEVFDTPV